MKRLKTILWLAVCVPMTAVLADDQHPVSFETVNWQETNIQDMEMFQPYIGTFRGETYTADSGTEYYFTITYAYYDLARTVVKYTLETHIPSRQQIRPLGEGFYMWDAFTSRIKVVGVFRDGRIGSGFMSPFDPETGAREVRIRASNPDGSQTQVRDTFWLIDENSWGNKTYISNKGAPWQAISETVYTRIES